MSKSLPWYNAGMAHENTEQVRPPAVTDVLIGSEWFEVGRESFRICDLTISESTASNAYRPPWGEGFCFKVSGSNTEMVGPLSAIQALKRKTAERRP